MSKKSTLYIVSGMILSVLKKIQFGTKCKANVGWQQVLYENFIWFIRKPGN
jgi:hypothetical protein